MRNLDIATLRAFIAVVEQGGVTRAATGLNLTQSAVSMQLKRLEDALGLQLLDRSNRKIGLTNAGEQLLTYARRMIALNDEVYGRLTAPAYEGEITLGVPHDIVYPVVPRVLHQFATAYPRVNVNLRSSRTIRLHEAHEKGEIDLYLTTEGALLPGGETLTQMRLRWIGARDGVAWKKRPLRLAFCRWCIFRSVALRALDDAGIPWDMAVESEDDRAVEALVSADLAVAAMLEDSIPPHQQAIEPGSGLPDLGHSKINMYGKTGPWDEALTDLADMLRRGYQTTGRPMLMEA